MPSLLETFTKVLETYDTEKQPRKSSLIAPWLGIDRTPSGLSQRVGNYLEDVFAADQGEQCKLHMTDFKRGRNFMISHKGTNHQIDILAIPSDWEKYKKFLHREMKTNLDLDNGKKRDTLSREEAICEWMTEKGWKYDSGIFCPFFYSKGQHVSGLGWVDGLEWYVKTFKPNWDIQEFIDLGRKPEVHRLLGLID